MSVDQHTPTAKIAQAIETGLQSLVAHQAPNGSFLMPCRGGVALSALAHLTVHSLGNCSPDDNEKLLHFFHSCQLKNGSFAAYPFGSTGSLAATCAVWGVLTKIGNEPTEPCTFRAKNWIDSHGGIEALGKLPLGEDPFCVGPILAYAGLLDPKHLNERFLPLLQCLLPWVEKRCEKKANVAFLLQEEWLAALVSSMMAREASPDTQCPFQQWLERHEMAALEKSSERFQNPNGSWDDTCCQTVLALCSLNSMGLPASSPVIKRGVQWLQANRIETQEQLQYISSGSNVWDTSLSLDALLRAQEAGVSLRSSSITAAVRWLVCKAQHTDSDPAPAASGERQKSGGWAFEAHNPRFPDCDDTGVTIAAVGRFLAQPEHWITSQKAAPLRASAATAVETARSWLLQMQHSDGGWGAFMPEQPQRRKMLLFEQPMMDATGVSWARPESIEKFLETQMQEVADVSTSGLTGRVLLGLAAAGATTSAPAVQNALKLIENQQRNGAWFGRWVVNYVGGTAWVLRGLGALGIRHSDNTPMGQVAKGAVRWLTLKQNADGGWGETPLSYSHPPLAGVGPSMPGLTALALTGLLEVGHRGDELHRAANYLMSEQLDTGGWNDDNWLQVLFPPNCFYVMPSASIALPLQALAGYLAMRNGSAQRDVQDERVARKQAEARANRAPDVRVRDKAGSWDPAGLRAMRHFGDASADRLVLDVLREYERLTVNKWLVELAQDDDPTSDGPIPAVNSWFAQTEQLPPWANCARIQRAQDFFVEHNVEVILCLFCSALPQAYAAANGAGVLVRTGGMTRKLRHRVLETAQFLFDVLPPGSFKPKARGLRAIQKVRLLHATVRTLLLQQLTWDDSYGVPINQEDIAGTMLTFSVVILQGLEKLGCPVSDTQAEDWVHLWCVVGHLLGLDARLIPKNLADANRLMAAIRNDQWQTSEQGRLLTSDLADMIGEYLPIPGGVDVAYETIRALAGDRCADILGIPKHKLTDRIVNASLSLVRHLLKRKTTPKQPTLLMDIGEHILQGLVSVQREGKQAQFRIPDAILHSWKRSA